MENDYSVLTEDYADKPNRYYTSKRKEIQSYIPASTKKLLDIGCGRGAFGADLKQQRPGLTVWGVEPFQEAAKSAASVLDKIICNVFDAQSPDLQNQKFDCITFNDVLEHLIDPSQTLKDSQLYLEREGCIIASIPNILYFPVFFNQIILREDWKYEDSGILDSTHLRFFTKKSIKRLFEEAGYDVIKIEGINAGKSKLYIIFNLLLLNRLKNWKYQQFIIQAKIKNRAKL